MRPVKTIGNNFSGRDLHIGSSPIPAVFNQFCDVPKHTVGEQLFKCAKRNGSRPLTSLQP